MLIYGANGYTGELIAREAVRRGLRPLLAGRNAAAVAELAAELGLEHRACGLDDPTPLLAAIADQGAVLHCAGPFSRTSAPMVAACLTSGVHYLDITGEIPVFERVLGQDARARERGVALLPGVGFDVVPTDCLAARLAAALPGATELRLAFVQQGGSISRGTLKTMIESMPHAGAIRKDGRIVPVPLAWDSFELQTPWGRRSVATIPWGDVATAFHTTGIPNIRVYTGMAPARVRRMRRMGKVLPLLGLAPVKRLLQWWVGRTVIGPDEEARSAGRVWLWGRASKPDGEAVETTLETPEAYGLTALSSVESLRRVLAGEVAPGSWTPARAFGPDFVGTLPGVVVGELRRVEAA